MLVKFVFVLTACLFLSLPAWAQTVPLELTLVGTVDGSQPAKNTSVGLTITNTSDHYVSIEHTISVEQVAKFKWVPQTAIDAIDAVTTCSKFASDNPRGVVKIAAHAALQVKPFNGLQCGDECSMDCLSNYQMLPGTYRFVVITPEGQRLPSPTFKLP